MNRRIKQHPFAIWTLAWSPDSAQIASAGHSREVWLWDARTLHTRLIVRQRHSGVPMLAWSPDGARLAVGGQDGAISLWDTHTGALLLTYGMHRAPISVLVWSQEGSQVASSSKDSFLHIWNASTGERVFCRQHGYYRERRHREADALAWSPDGRYLAAGEGCPVLTIWDMTSGELVEWMWDEDHVLFANTLSWPFRGQRLLCDYSGAPLAFFKGTRLFASGHARTMQMIAPSPDGQYLAVPSRQNDAIHICRANWRSREAVFLYDGHQQRVTALEWSPDGTRIASADQDGTIHLWQPDLSQMPPEIPTF